MIPVRILGTASMLPGRAVTTEELSRQLGREPAAMMRRTGIRTRHWAEPEAKVAELGAQVLRQALEVAGLEARQLRRLLFVSSTGGEILIPASANRVSAALGLAGTCDGIDLNNACMGFLSAFDLASRCVATGLSPVGIVVVELGSRIVDASDARPYLVFGDAVAAAVLGPARPGEGLLSSVLANDGTLPPDTVLEHPVFTGRPEKVRFHVSRDEILQIAMNALSTATRTVLDQARVTLADIQWVLPHQPNGAMLRAIVEGLGIAPERIVPVVEETGSVGAASIPVSLDRLWRTRPVKPGDRILMVGVGAGVSHGALLYQVGE
ncbi:3-oxoacyl-ACP synthase III family protein [Hyalangium rubrum]|uniref:Ketoacyl-ACP synthase III n=1 Tax=Hyalangium rubrum TaxID=3103134 RepID=A0ABU5H4K9_9BACT|nr:ketoacyl-ACP synthase III [Hyalangium sp. s54d21]MDY7228251.1 ketoacyl-ACP synthase III [Hyalangium sp. s54d21]